MGQHVRAPGKTGAATAYRKGLLPASKIKRIPGHLIRLYCKPEESHDCSKKYGSVPFYDIRKVRATFAFLRSDEWPANPAAVEALAAHRQAMSRQSATFTGCRVTWIEWSGTGYRRKPNQRSESDCKVQVGHRIATITLPGGRTFIKRLDTQGFSYEPGERVEQAPTGNDPDMRRISPPRDEFEGKDHGIANLEQISAQTESGAPDYVD